MDDGIVGEAPLAAIGNAPNCEAASAAAAPAPARRPIADRRDRYASGIATDANRFMLFPFLRRPAGSSAFPRACIDLAPQGRWAHRGNSPIGGVNLEEER